MKLTDLLRAEGPDPERVLVFRYRPHEPELNRVPPWLAAERPEGFNAYRQTPGPTVEKATLWRLVALISVVALACLADAKPAVAQLQLCNKSNTVAYVAVGFRRSRVWTSEGWFQVRAGRCETVLGGRLGETLYYLYAEGADGTTWSGKGENVNGDFCVNEKHEFTIPEPKDARGKLVPCDRVGLTEKKFWGHQCGGGHGVDREHCQ